jgi:hypothetical protein
MDILFWIIVFRVCDAVSKKDGRGSRKIRISLRYFGILFPTSFQSVGISVIGVLTPQVIKALRIGVWFSGLSKKNFQVSCIETSEAGVEWASTYIFSVTPEII